MLALGLFADALFGLIAVVNSAIGIRQELRAKETLDQLAVLVAPKARAVRDGQLTELRGDEVVPGDIVLVEPGDQLVADGVVVVLARPDDGRVDPDRGVRRGPQARAATGSSPARSASWDPAYYEVDAVREQSYAEQVAGEARAFRHPPSPLQVEVNSVLRATTIVMVPLAILLLLAFSIRSVGLHDAAQTATAGLVTLIPEGLVLLMSVTLAVAAVRLARMSTLVQQMAATESLAAVDTDLRRQDRDAHRRHPRPGLGRGRRQGPVRRRARGARPLRALRREREPHPRDDRRALPRQRREQVVAEVPFSSAWKWSGADARRRRVRPLATCSALPTCSGRRGRSTLPPALERSLERAHDRGTARGGVRRGVGAPSAGPRPPAAAEARGARPGRARGAASPGRRRDDRVHARAAGRPEADLGRRPRRR